VIALHRVELSGAAPDWLSADELERAGRFRVEHARRAFVACRSALRRVLGERLGVAPAALTFTLSAHGRPSVAGGRVSFNVSHSGEVGLIAVADGERRIGVDVEQVRTTTDIEALAERFFHPEEAAAIAGRRDAFFRCWTKKEAVVKAIGQGLSHPLETFVVDVDDDAPAPVAGVEGLTVAGLPVDVGYTAALAADGELEYAWMA
jgi:4'-phosphopantetheinyl transferase